MIPEKCYTFPVMLAYDPYLTMVRVIVFTKDEGIILGERGEMQANSKPSFIAHHENIELHIIANNFGEIERAREAVIEMLFNHNKRLYCTSISDNMTPDEYKDWDYIPF